MATMNEGTHDVTVVETALGESKNANPETGLKSDYLAIKFENDRGEHITAFLYLSEKAWPYTEEKLDKLFGWNAKARGYRFEELNSDTSPLVGKRATIVVENEEYQGKTRAKVRYINELGAVPGIERMKPAEARSFADRLRQRLLGNGGGPVVEGSTGNDDIPF